MLTRKSIKEKVRISWEKDFMINKAHKINTKEFKEYYPRSKKTSTPFFRIGIAASDKEISQCAVVIPKKIIKKAHARQREKRRVYNWIQKNMHTYKDPRYFFIFIHKDTKILNHQQIEHELEQAFKKAF